MVGSLSSGRQTDRSCGESRLVRLISCEPGPPTDRKSAGGIRRTEVEVTIRRDRHGWPGVVASDQEMGDERANRIHQQEPYPSREALGVRIHLRRGVWRDRFDEGANRGLNLSPRVAPKAGRMPRGRRVERKL
jgi:hypothetical protein